MRFSKKISFLTVVFFFLLCGHGHATQMNPNQQVPKMMEQEDKSLVVQEGFIPAPVNLLDTLTPGEKKWFQRFQDGAPFLDGWKKITQSVVAKFPEQERAQRLAVMRELGLKIGSEWSRDDHIRKVDTDMLRAWGRELRQAGAENHVQLAKVLFKIEKEVNHLLHLE
jgi:hypothetical protein